MGFHAKYQGIVGLQRYMALLVGFCALLEPGTAFQISAVLDISRGLENSRSCRDNQGHCGKSRSHLEGSKADAATPPGIQVLYIHREYLHVALFFECCPEVGQGVLPCTAPEEYLGPYGEWRQSCTASYPRNTVIRII